MHKRSTHSNRVGLETWQKLPEWNIEKISNKLYAAKIGLAITTTKEILSFEDPNIKISTYYTEANKILGYTFSTKKDFLINIRYWHMVLVNPKCQEHINPEIIHKDTNLHVHRFNEINQASYWIVLRWRS